MISFIDALVVGRVIGEVVDMFVPTVNMTVSYGSKEVNNGCDVKPSMATERPTVQISGLFNEFYTLVMTDPDAPSPSEPTLREVVHWVVVDIPGGTDVTQGLELLPYLTPAPALGIHRYVFVLYQQRGLFPLVAPWTSRANFSTRLFANHFDLGLPVATVYFNCQKEPMPRRRRT